MGQDPFEWLQSCWETAGPAEQQAAAHRRADQHSLPAHLAAQPQQLLLVRRLQRADRGLLLGRQLLPERRVGRLLDTGSCRQLLLQLLAAALQLHLQLGRARQRLLLRRRRLLLGRRLRGLEPVQLRLQLVPGGSYGRQLLGELRGSEGAGAEQRRGRCGRQQGQMHTQTAALPRSKPRCVALHCTASLALLQQCRRPSSPPPPPPPAQQPRSPSRQHARTLLALASASALAFFLISSTFSLLRLPTSCMSLLDAFSFSLAALAISAAWAACAGVVADWAGCAGRGVSCDAGITHDGWSHAPRTCPKLRAQLASMQAGRQGISHRQRAGPLAAHLRLPEPCLQLAVGLSCL